MEIPKEFEDIFRGVDLTEDEIRTLHWLVGWERRTVENLRSAIRKAQATALSTLQAENEKLRAELEHWKNAHHDAAQNFQAENEICRRLSAELAQKSKLIAQQAAELERRDKLLKEQEIELERVKQLYETEKEDFGDFACSGVPNLSPYCMNRRPNCVDERGWCRSEKCHGFSRDRGQREN